MPIYLASRIGFVFFILISTAPEKRDKNRQSPHTISMHVRHHRQYAGNSISCQFNLHNSACRTLSISYFLSGLISSKCSAHDIWMIRIISSPDYAIFLHFSSYFWDLVILVINIKFFVMMWLRTNMLSYSFLVLELIIQVH